MDQSKRIYMLKLHLPSFSKDNILRAARTLSGKSVVLNDRKLPYPSNRVYFAEYKKKTDEIQVILVLKMKEVNEIYEKGKQVYATASISKNPPFILSNLLSFTELILSTKPLKSGYKTNLSRVPDLNTTIRMLP
jgi:hypothetical protein